MTVNYFHFLPCCQGGVELFFSGSPDLLPIGVYLYEGNCYTVIYVYKTINQDLPPIVPGALTSVDTCDEVVCDCCNCIRVRAVDINGEGTTVQITDCNEQVQNILVPENRIWSEKICASSWDIDLNVYEVESFGNCSTDDPPEPCSNHRVTIPFPAPAGIITYTDCEGVAQSISYPAIWYSSLTFTFCALDSEPVVVPEGGSDNIIGPCSGVQTYSCPVDTCFLLTDCEGIEEDIYATYASIQNYITGDAILKIDGYPNTCWSFREISECECAIEITVVSSWVDCTECRKCKGFKLTNCENNTYVKYTTNDLSEYIGKSVEFENCSGCWIVECMEIAPPNDQNLIVAYVFDNCQDCLSTFWRLDSCVGDVDPIYTDTDLSAYAGFIITLDNIPDVCWTLEEVRDLEGNDFETVFLNTYYTDCLQCLADILDCQCSSVVNGSPSPAVFSYLDCNGFIATTAPILPGQRTPRMCVVRWDPDNESIVDIEWYGECTEELAEDVNNDSIWTCPTAVIRLRTVRPGYNTLICTSAYFDKVSCKFSEALYKEVLADRYGIVTDCSKKELEKWEIKKELLNLTIITNPDYDCLPVLTCNNVCSTSAAFVNCLTGSCHSYTITYQANAPADVITYTDCTTCEITTINHASSDAEIVYNICTAPGTPIVTEGFLEHTGDCEPGPPPLPLCIQYTVILNAGTPAGSYTYRDCAGAPQTVNYPNQIAGTIAILCAEEGSIVSVGTVNEIGPCP